ncbi:O-antigen ligase [Bdellovibrio sp. KM01]|uniref:O-antigen ligase family protein n=1 Tax=Bdellovibrio sp. KM01 TaxID=2748865 RepID=UPI0015E99A40|nr:O-antigen ligase family protein [Bdellovibrio sp. KM01]QLY26005.1 O-antigen ligase family protein [Bdellovibrio sp. KM01]
MIHVKDARILFLIKCLVALTFLCKVSLGGILPIPREVPYLIFQQGMHPYINVLLTFLFGGPLVLLWLRVRARQHLSGFYKLFVFFLMIVLAVQTLLQVYYVNPDESAIMQIGAMLVSLFMVGIYGLIIPSLWNVQDFLRFVQRWTGALVLLSLVVLVLHPGSTFKGGRFIGVFKHIPHMVTCATTAFVFSLGTFLLEYKLKHKIWNSLILFVSFIAIILTGTRSSAAAAMFAFLLTLILHETRTTKGRMFKFGVVSFLTTFTLFFGMQSYELAHDIATGHSSLGGRQAQDGIASRLEEVERGSEIFKQEPWLGHGLMSKFASGNDVDVSNYNSFKDPHNIFVSAGVVGGWPLLVLAAIALGFMTIGSLKALKTFSIAKRQVSIYLLAHIPILVIYHIHLSIGGMADRLYWMVFGFVAAAVFEEVRIRSASSTKETISAQLGLLSKS